MDIFKELFEDLKGDVGVRSIAETMSTSDLPNLLLGTALDRALLKAYREYPADYEGYVYLDKVKDFRTADRIYEYGGDGALNEVKELEPYQYSALADGKYEIKVAKFGRKIGFSWEAYLNDDLGALRRITEKLARAARRTELKLITSLLCDDSGPNSTLFTSGRGNLGSAVLGVDGLNEALSAIGEQTDPNGEPFFVSRFHLIVPPSLEVKARSILEAIELLYVDEDEVNYRTNNWVKNKVVLHVNPYLSVINTTNGDKAWYVLPDPADIETLVLAKLTGHEEPEIFMKNPNAMRIGGGEDPFGGDFDTDSIEYKVRHVVGGAVFDWRGCYASTGTATTS